MTSKEEIDKAIAAHGMWKTRLKQAIDTGEIDLPVATIRTDDHCVFGKWLNGPTHTAVDKASDHYKTVKQLHAEFHKIAAGVAELAVAGHKKEAVKIISLGGEYASVSAKLTAAMKEWKKS